MKKINLLLLISLLSITTFAQAPFPTKRNMELFMKSKTLVVLEPTMFSDFNIYIKKTIEDYWKITPFEFIEFKEFEEKKTDSTYSFLVLVQTTFERDIYRNPISHRMEITPTLASWHKQNRLPSIRRIYVWLERCKWFYPCSYADIIRAVWHR